MNYHFWISGTDDNSKCKAALVDIQETMETRLQIVSTLALYFKASGQLHATEHQPPIIIKIRGWVSSRNALIWWKR
jgi:hypothetical protein